MNDVLNFESLVGHMVVAGTWIVLLSSWIAFVIHRAIKARREDAAR